MGWTGIFDDDGSYRDYSERKDYINHIITYKDDDRAITVLKSRMIGGTYYAAARFDYDLKNGRSFIGGIVVATHYVRRPYGHELQFKEMTEDMGPVEDRCPASILKMLDPTDNEYAIDWRRRCQKNIEASRARRKEASHV